MDNRVMIKTTSQRQIEREAEKDVDAAQAALEDAEDELEKARGDGGLKRWRYRAALRTIDRAIANHAEAILNLERTTHDDPDT